MAHHVGLAYFSPCFTFADASAAHGVPCVQALRYARMAAVVCASAFEVGRDLAPDSLPFLGDVGHRQVMKIAAHGSCAELDEHR